MHSAPALRCSSSRTTSVQTFWAFSPSPRPPLSPASHINYSTDIIYEYSIRSKSKLKTSGYLRQALLKSLHAEYQRCCQRPVIIPGRTEGDFALMYTSYTYIWDEGPHIFVTGIGSKKTHLFAILTTKLGLSINAGFSANSL